MRSRLLLAVPVFAFVMAAAAEPPSRDALAGRNFAERALAAGQRQVAAAELAAERSESAAVKGFAADVITDFKLLNPWLAAQLDKRQSEGDAISGWSAAEIPYKRREYQRLRALKGAAFDRQFLLEAAISYEQSIRRFEAETKGDDGFNKRFAETVLPRLRAQLGRAHQLLADIEAKSSPAASQPVR